MRCDVVVGKRLRLCVASETNAPRTRFFGLNRNGEQRHQRMLFHEGSYFGRQVRLRQDSK